MTKNLISLSKVKNFSETDKEFFPLCSDRSLKYPPELAVFQNIFWQLKHEKPPKDDLLKLLFLFSPKVRLTEQQLDEKQEFTITAREYANLTGTKLESAYSALANAVEILYQHSVIFYHQDKQRNIRTRLISTCSYENGCFYIAFTHFALYIMSAFNKDNPFTKFTLKSAVSLNGHSLKLYPFLVQNEFRRSFDVAIDDLKSALGISVNAYSDFKEFKKKVLKPHIDSINEKTELSVQFVAVKKNSRKANYVNFTVTKKITVKEETPVTDDKVPEEQNEPKKITAKAVYSEIIKLNLLERMKQAGETTQELLERIKHDFQNDQAQHWIFKLEEFGAVFNT